MKLNLSSAKPLHLGLAASFLLIQVWSGIRPKLYFIWFLEVVPSFIALGVLVFTYNRFRLTTPVYVLLWVAALIMAVGGHYTYGDVPLFNWLKQNFGLARNFYDRFAHFVEGGVAALTVRELLTRLTPLRGKRLVALVIAICLALSALYELGEWGIGGLLKSSAEDYVGLQGDIWDTQWDMLLALSGSLLSLILLSNLHDRCLREETWNHLTYM